MDANWWEGVSLDARGHATAQSGLFPANFVRELEVKREEEVPATATQVKREKGESPTEIQKYRVLSGIKSSSRESTQSASFFAHDDDFYIPGG